ncbi:MAG: hypothetical protein JWO03_2764 [Bacteroidetes bacterium]|nr:hypothetical protein [Bacteroidota bacterium]
MENFNYRREIPLWLLLIAPIIYIIIAWSSLPERVPIHFDINGHANNWGSKEAIFLMPGAGVFTYLLLLFLPQIDPKKMSVEFFNSNFYKIRVAVTIFLSVISILITYITLTHDTGGLAVRFIPISGLLLISVIGNFLINVKPNWFIGVRTPWTLSSDHVWKQTHLVLGRIWFYGGFAGIILALIVGIKWLAVVMLAFAIISTVVAVVYSYLLYRNEQKNNGVES